MLLALMVSPARADEITTRGQHYRKIKIVDYAFGQIRFRRAAGELANVSVLDVQALLVDTAGGVSDLNQAEIYIDKGQPPQAVLRYERALRSTKGFWKELVRVRLLQACDQAGYLDKTVTQWLAVLKRDPALAAELLPGSIPPTRTRAVNRALSKIEDASAKTTDEAARRLMNLLLFSIHERLGDDAADGLAERIAASLLTGPLATVPAYGIKIDALGHLFGMKRVAQVLTGLDIALRDCPKGSMPELLLFKGEVLYATARGREDYIRSGWAFMRVPIHFPDDPLTAAALLGAARAHEKIGAPEKAAELLRECLAVKSSDAKTRAAAAKALERLTARESKVQGPETAQRPRRRNLDLGPWTLDWSAQRTLPWTLEMLT